MQTTYFLCITLIVCCITFVLSDVNSIRNAEPSLCYDNVDSPYILFSTKTGYRVNQNKDDEEVKVKGCVAKQLWLMSRHGTRNTGTKDMIKMKEKLPLIFKDIKLNHKEGRGSLCEDDINNLEDWEFIANVTEDKFLVREGFLELKGLGRRFQKRFPTLLSKPYVNESYEFQFTDSERTDVSAQAFAKGMFGKKDSSNVYMKKSPKPDNLLRFYRTCDKWLKEVDENPDATIEKKLFEKTPEFLSMIKSVSDRLGFTSLRTLGDIDLMYSMCSFDKAWRPKDLSAWCAVFNENDLQILEYREDLEYFYEDGYGYSINYEQACTPLKHIIENFGQTVQESEVSRPKGFFYFTHSGTILKVLARMGLFEDAVRPTHLNRLDIHKRAWRTSLIDSFASNIAFALFKCSDDYRVTAYFQERPVRLPGCSHELCHFREFVNQYGSLAEKCNVEDICRI
ncbi:multiple inositol polyphosphate phosphatase 1 [Daphnia magna]|uniref:Multiple inositol polyphosphate phosphatase 1 n=1 Tax=Daphnia magna TaxID=35525 RepID=A0A0P4ZC10_9CRUS|nr:multiple inositol polyphosphate phosphatase 1 [Daphnia magna]